MEIRNILNSNVDYLIKTINNRDQEISEQLPDFYSGKIINNNDPDKQGKCQIRVYGVFDDNIPDSDLPWALPDFNFIGSKKGSFVVPPIGAIVKVYFDQGDLYNPHYTTKAVDLNNLSDLRLNNYPDTMVMFETDEGDYLTINRKSKETTYNHNSGTKILIKEDGTVEINIVKDKTENVNGDVVLKSDQKIIIEAQSDIDIKGTASITVHGTPVPNGGIGPFCLLPVCPVTGATLQTNKATGGTP